MWAAHWLVQGYDGDALRMLAGFSGTDAGEVHDILPAAFADCGETVSDSRSVACGTAFATLARVFLNGDITPQWLLGLVYGLLVDADYDNAVMAMPLGQLFIVEDEWSGRWGRTESELTVVVEQACREQLADGSARQG